MRKLVVAGLLAVVVCCPLLAIPLGAFMAVSLSGSGSSATAGAQPSGAASAESLTVDDATVNTVAAVTGLPSMAVRGLAIVAAMSQGRVGCDVPWWLLGGIGNAESGNGTTMVDGVQASIGSDWVVRPPIGGLLLDGVNFDLIVEAGQITRALGPFQFIPGSWRLFGEDANGDGVNDIDNYLDAALAAANHLCHSAGGPGSDLRDPATARRGILGYNHSDSYADDVWSTGLRYRDQAGDVLTAIPGQASSGQATDAYGVTVAATDWTGPIIEGADGLDRNFTNRLSALAAATLAATGGRAYVFSGFRSIDEQRSIIANHDGVCGVWVACVDETTGTCGSFHCKGLAADMAWTTDAADAYWHAHAAEFGVKQALDYEDWHYEPVETRGG